MNFLTCRPKVWSAYFLFSIHNNQLTKIDIRYKILLLNLKNFREECC